MVFVERVTTTIRTVLPAGLPGRKTTPYLSVVTDDQFCFSQVVYLLCGFLFLNSRIALRSKTLKSRVCFKFLFLKTLNLTIKLSFLVNFDCGFVFT